MAALLPDFELHLVSLAAGIAAAPGGAAGPSLAGLQQPPPGWSAAATTGMGAGDKLALLNSLLSSDAGPPAALHSLDGVAPAVQAAAAHAAQLAMAAAGLLAEPVTVRSQGAGREYGTLAVEAPPPPPPPALLGVSAHGAMASVDLQELLGWPAAQPQAQAQPRLDDLAFVFD